jgi:hypothetical protein
VTILGRGDLAPRRRGRGRRTSILAVLLAVAALAAAGWWGWHSLRGGSTASAGPAVVCTTPSSAPSPPPPKTVHVAVLNTTPAVGLAHTVAAQLTLRGLSIARVGNTVPALAGAPQVGYAAGDRAAALTLAEQVLGATVVELATAKPGVVELHLSTGFHRLATPAEAGAAHVRDVAAAAPSPAICSTPRS